MADDDTAALIARYAEVTQESNSDVRDMRKCALLDQLGEAAPHSDEALTVIAAALADEDGYESGASPYDAWYEIVAEHAYRALLPIAARAEGVVVAQLEQSLRREDDAVRRHGATPWERIRNHTGVRCREYAAILLNHISTLSPSAVDALMRCASDPSHKVQQAVGQALRGRVDVSVLLANPESRPVGLIASPAIAASQAPPRCKNGYTARVLDTEGKRLYDAVVAEPSDDAPRLAMAAHFDRQGDPWGAFIRVQLALTKALQVGTREEAARYREETEQLARRYGSHWTNGVTDLVDSCKFSRGFVEHVMVDANRYLSIANELFQRAPIRQLVLLEVGDLLGEVLRDRRLSQLVMLSLENTSRKRPIGDTGAAALAVSPNLSGLKMLGISRQDIGMPGLEALCASKTLLSLEYVNFWGNRVDDPIEGYGTDWATGVIVREGAYLSSLGRELEAKFGEIPWLHGPSRLRNFPPQVEEL